MKHNQSRGGLAPIVVLGTGVVFVVLVIAAGVLWRVVRSEPSISGPPPTLPENLPATSLNPDDANGDTESDAPVQLDDIDEVTTTTTTTEPPGPPRITVRADGTGDFVDLQMAIDVAQPGDVIEVGSGEWSEQVVRTVGSPDAWLQITAAPGERPVIRGVENGESGFELDGAAYVELSGFELVGPPDTQSGAGVRVVNGANHIRIEANTIHGFPGNGVEVIEAGSVAVVNNEIYGNSRRSPFQTSGISFFQPFGDDAEGFDNVVSGNVVYDNENAVGNFEGVITDGNCIIMDNGRWVDGSYEYPGDTLIENNVCFDNGGRGIHVLKADNVFAVNNTLFNNLRTESIRGGEMTADEARNVIFRNNVVWPRTLDRARLVVESESIAFDNNVYVLNGADPGDFEPSALIVDDVQLVNPSIDPTTADFSPQPESVIVGQGSGEDAPEFDFAGQVRPVPPTPGALEPPGP